MYLSHSPASPAARALTVEEAASPTDTHKLDLGELGFHGTSHSALNSQHPLDSLL